MHGNGNDFVIIDEFDEVLIPENKKKEFVKAVSHRKFGIGADGVIFIQKSKRYDAKFRYFNSDGSEAEMCGNGVRCLARYLFEEKIKKNKLTIETKAGPVKVEIKNGSVFRVKLGSPRLKWNEIPATYSTKIPWKKRLEIDNFAFDIYALRLCVPHAVIVVNDFDFNLKEIGRKIRFNENFPEGVNVNFVKVLSKSKLIVKTYERGVEDITLSCGTGCGASVSLLHLLKISSNYVEIITDGGVLYIEVKNNSVYLEGAVKRVFDGYIKLPELNFNF